MKQEVCAEDQLKYVTKGWVTQETQRAFTDVYWRKSTYLKILSGLILLLVLCGAWFLTDGDWFSLVVDIVLIAALIAAFSFSRRRAVRVYDYRHASGSEPEDAAYMTGYADTFVYTENQSRHTCARVPYEDIRYVYETGKYLFLLTRDAAFIETFFDQLSTEDQKGLLAFLKQKGVKKKW